MGLNNRHTDSLETIETSKRSKRQTKQNKKSISNSFIKFETIYVQFGSFIDVQFVLFLEKVPTIAKTNRNNLQTKIYRIILCTTMSELN